MSIPLSLQKISSFLEKHKYVLQKVFTTGNNVKFLEVKTPIHKKIFFINVPNRYVLKGSVLPEGKTSVTIYESHEKKHLKTFVDMFKNLGLCITTVSSKRICWFCNDETFFWTFSKPLIDTVTTEGEKENTIVENLEEELKQVKSNVTTDKDMELVSPPEEDKELSLEEEEGIDLVFEDKDGNEIENLEEIMEDTEKPKKVHIDKDTVVDYTPTKKFVEKKKTKISKGIFEEEPETFSIYNEIPENFKDKKINIGIIYISININDFLKTAETFEDVLIQQYKSIDLYEDKTREEKVLELGDLVSQFRINSMEKLQKSREKERDLKEKIERLTAILVSCENIRVKNPTEEVIKVQQKTRITLDDLNIEILKIRDEMARFLRNCKQHLEEMGK